MAGEPYDSTEETTAHINRVRELVQASCGNLADRAAIHDASKLSAEEKDAFDRGTPALKGLKYGSSEYRAAFKEYGMQDAVLHHYAHNSHHPEFYAIGRELKVVDLLVSSGVAIGQMSLLDLLEMVCDWKAASERHATGDIGESLKINIKRFGIGEQLAGILYATIVELGFIEAGSLELPAPHRPEISCAVKLDSAVGVDPALMRADLFKAFEQAVAFFELRAPEVPIGGYIEGAVTIDWTTP